MKVRKIESLKKNVYLIDGYDDDNDAYYYMSDCPILKRYRCLGKLKDLTESDCEPIVDFGEPYFDDIDPYHPIVTRKDYKGFHLGLWTPKESFLSALEASGLHLNGNPIKMYGGIPSRKKYNDWQEAEQNVFSGETLVFVEQ